jgi:hypothetical protein
VATHHRRHTPAVRATVNIERFIVGHDWIGGERLGRSALAVGLARLVRSR